MTKTLQSEDITVILEPHGNQDEAEDTLKDLGYSIKRVPDDRNYLVAH